MPPDHASIGITTAQLSSWRGDPAGLPTSDGWLTSTSFGASGLTLGASSG
jgi:hypothetical protein